ncbi:MAG: 30S ribosomal protein S7 [Actinobacteria bacterium]|nr:30S ribosomal protein S7 [Actinomycetota bacterium]
MPRRAVVTRRPLDPDPVYQNTVVTQIINKVLRDGKKSVAEGIVYDALERIRDRTGRDPVSVMEEAIRNVTPVLEVRSRRVGGANYQVPVEVPPRRGRTLAIRWLVRFAQERREKQMSERMANELLDALGSQGGAFKRKDDIYRMAQANKAFAHYRW